MFDCFGILKLTNKWTSGRRRTARDVDICFSRLKRSFVSDKLTANYSKQVSLSPF